MQSNPEVRILQGRFKLRNKLHNNCVMDLRHSKVFRSSKVAGRKLVYKLGVRPSCIPLLFGISFTIALLQV